MDIKLTIPDILGQTIRDMRVERDIKASEMHEMLGCSAHHYSNIENGHVKPGYAALIAILRYLDIDPNVFVYPERRHLDAKRLQLIHAIETCDETQLDFMFAVWNTATKKDKPE